MDVPAGRSKNHGQNLKAGTQRVVPRGDGKQTVLAHGLSCRSQQKPGPGYEGREGGRLLEVACVLSLTCFFMSSSKRLTATGIPIAAMSSTVRYVIVSFVL